MKLPGLHTVADRILRAVLGGAITLAEIEEATREHLPTVAATCSTLCRDGILLRIERGRYALAPEATELLVERIQAQRAAREAPAPVNLIARRPARKIVNLVLDAIVADGCRSPAEIRMDTGFCLPLIWSTLNVLVSEGAIKVAPYAMDGITVTHYGRWLARTRWESRGLALGSDIDVPEGA